MDPMLAVVVDVVRYFWTGGLRVAICWFGYFSYRICVSLLRICWFAVGLVLVEFVRCLLIVGVTFGWFGNLPLVPSTAAWNSWR